MKQANAGGFPAAMLVTTYCAALVVPLAVAWSERLPTRGFATEFSSGLAMSCLVMLLAQFLTSGRFESTTGRAGIDLTMRAHQLAARVLAALLVLHPLLYALPAARAGAGLGAAAVAGLFSAPRFLTGVLAWILLLALVFSAILRDRLPVRYEIWRATHGIGSLAVAALGVHHVLTAGRYAATSPMLTGLWIGLLAAALLSLVHVYAIIPLLQLRRPWRISGVKRAGDRLWELSVDPAAAFVPRFTAGQFFWLTLDRSPFSITEHPFSVASAPAELPRLRFLIKESGDFTNRLGSLPVGARAYLHGPRGNFTLAGRDAAGIGLVAGGVGLAPILSILRQLRADHDPRPVRLLVGNRHAGQIVYADEIAAMAKVLDLKVRYILSDPAAGWRGGRGTVSRAELDALFDAPDREHWVYFVCGPPPMMDTVEHDLRSMGVPPMSIISERFCRR